MTTGHLVQECGEAIAAALDKADAVELLYLVTGGEGCGDA